MPFRSEIDDGRAGNRVEMGIARLSADRRNKGAGQLVVDKLILQQRGEHPGEMEACADGEVPAPCDVGRVVADGPVESASGLKCERMVKNPVMAAARSATLAVLATAGPAAKRRTRSWVTGQRELRHLQSRCAQPRLAQSVLTRRGTGAAKRAMCKLIDRRGGRCGGRRSRLRSRKTGRDQARDYQQTCAPDRRYQTGE